MASPRGCRDDSQLLPLNHLSHFKEQISKERRGAGLAATKIGASGIVAAGAIQRAPVGDEGVAEEAARRGSVFRVASEAQRTEVVALLRQSAW